MSSDDLKLVFQLTRQGDLLEVRLAAPGGECRVETQPPSSTIPTQMAALEETGVAETVLAGVGQTLYGCLVAGEAAELVAETLHRARDPRAAIHFELRFDPDQAALAQFPWETIADPAGQFLVRDGKIALTRYITYPQPPALFDVALDHQPLLRVIAQPAGLPSVAAGELGISYVETLEHATFESLQQKLLIQRLTAWGMHFDGHGGLMLRCQKCKTLEPPGTLACSRCSASLSGAPALGVLLFERNGGYDLITTEELGSVLYNADIRFALLSACESASIAGSTLFNGLAPGLMTAGVPAVIGMQYRISNDFASSFAIKFYAALIQQKDIVQALTVARTMLRRSAWYSPALYLRQHQAVDERLKPTYETRDIDTAVPAEVSVGTPFLVRLWIRRPETPVLTEEQLRTELGVPDRVAVNTRTREADIKFEPIADRKLRRGEVIIKLTSPSCEIVPPSIKLFVDEHLDAPPAIFTVKAIQPGPAALIFSVWQDGGQIASVSHQVQIVDAGKQPTAGINAGSYAVPIYHPTPPWGAPWFEAAQPRPSGGTPTPSPIPSTVWAPTPFAQSAPPHPESRHDLRRWLALVALLWAVAGLAAPLPTILTMSRISGYMGVLPPPNPIQPAASQDTLCLMCWPSLVIAFVVVQILAASRYWRSRRAPRVGRWLPATLLVGFLSLMVGISITVAILLPLF